MNMTLTRITSTIVTTSPPTVLIVIGHYCKLEHNKRDDTGGSDAADRRTVEAGTVCRCCCVHRDGTEHRGGVVVSPDVHMHIYLQPVEICKRTTQANDTNIDGLLIDWNSLPHGDTVG